MPPTLRRRAALAVALLCLTAVACSDGANAPGGTARAYLFAPAFASNLITVFDASTGAHVKDIGFQTRGPADTWPMPDGSKVFSVAGQAPHVVSIDVPSLAVTQVTPLLGTWGDRGMPVPRDGKLFWITDLPDGHIEALDTATSTIVRRFPLVASAATVSRDGATLYTVSTTTAPTGVSLTALTFASRSAETGEVIGSTTLPLTLPPVPLVLYATLDDAKVYVQLFSGTVHVINVRDRAHPQYLRSVEVGSVPVVAAFTPDGQQLWFPNSGDGTVSVLDVTRDEIVHVIEFGRYVAGVTIHDDRAYISYSTSPIPPLGPAAIAQIFLVLMPGANLNPPGGSTEPHPLYLELPGEIRAFDTRTYEALPLPAMKTPSISHVMCVVAVPG